MNQSPKKILIFSLVYLPGFVGGAEIAVKEITDRIPDVSFDMVTLHTEPNRVRIEGKITVYGVGPYVGGSGVLQKVLRAIMKYAFPFLAFRIARSLHRRHGYGGTWSIMANYAGFAALFFKLRFPRVPFLLTLQEGDPIPYIKRRVALVYPLFKMIFKKADRVQAISHYLARFAIDMGFRGLPAVIPNGVDIAHFSKPANPDDIRELRKEFGFSDADTVLITASRLVKKNGIADIVTALSLLPAECKLIVAGMGKLKQVLVSQTERLGLSERVRFVGFVPHKELPLYLQSSDVFIRPSLSEGLGNSFLEAMAAGIPVIATPVGGIPDFLFDGKTGLFCEVSDPRSIAAQVIRLGDSSLRAHLINHARAQVLAVYGWEGIARSMRGMFDSNEAQ